VIEESLDAREEEFDLRMPEDDLLIVIHSNLKVKNPSIPLHLGQKLPSRHSLINLAREPSSTKPKPISQRTQIPFAIYKQSIHVFIIEEANEGKNDKNYRKTQQVDIHKKRLTHATRPPKKLD
jgi:hypothetical protein